MKNSGLSLVFTLYRKGRAIFFGGQNVSEIPAVLKTLANSGKTVNLSFDLTKVEPVERENANNSKEPFYLFSVPVLAGNNYPSFSPTVTFGTLAAIATNGGNVKCVVTSKPGKNRKGEDVEYFSVAAETLPTITDALVDEVEEIFNNLPEAESDDLEPVLAGDDLENAD